MFCRRLRIFHRSGAPSRSSATRSASWTRTSRARAAWSSSISLTAGRPPSSTTSPIAPCSPVSRPIAATATASRSRRAAELPRALRHPARSVGVAASLSGGCGGRVRGRVRSGGPARRRRDPHLGSDERAEGDRQASRARAAPRGRACGGRRGRSADARRKGSAACQGGQGAPTLRVRTRRVRRGRKTPDLRGPARRAQAQVRRVRHGYAHGDAGFPAEALDHGPGRHQAVDAGRARASAARQRLQRACARAGRTRDARWWFHRRRLGRFRGVGRRADVSRR